MLTLCFSARLDSPFLTALASPTSLTSSVGLQQYSKKHARYSFLRRDAELCNILYDTDSGNLIVADFKRTEFRGRQLLGWLSPNSLNWKWKRSINQGKDDFAKELDHAIEKV